MKRGLESKAGATIGEDWHSKDQARGKISEFSKCVHEKQPGDSRPELFQYNAVTPFTCPIAGKNSNRK